ncbi:MAG: isoamylase early set domain-containing protein [Bacteroidota bacterium]
MSLKKQFLKSKPVCKVTFSMPKEAAVDANDVKVVGEFNDWDVETAVPMKALKNGSFKAVVELEAGREYQFRYIVNGDTWANDAEADRYVPTPFGVENGVVDVSDN